ncbi:MAG: SusD/RagB family nutrient-binding outer membrane lipoprotein [Bacteroidota bacterium]|nr:SusD/RagB family nutrient-binding outer membrane lipoprotein [Bacteroidota bacterium]
MKLLLKNLFIVILIVGFFSSCKKELLDINVDPNNPTTASATPSVVLPNALATTGAFYNNPTGGNVTLAFAGIWMGHISYSAGLAVSTENLSYAITNRFANGGFLSFGGVDPFTILYKNNEDYDFVEKKGAEQGNTFYRAVGMFMKAYNFQTLVDLYNNVPYTEALQGQAIPFPVYDQGKAIYDAISVKMDTAIALFKTSAGGNSTTGDIMFGGDITKWTKFANTVKLRLLLRQSEVNGATAKTQAGALSGGFVTSTFTPQTSTNATNTNGDVTVQPGYVNSSGKTNPFWGSNYNIAGNYTQGVYVGGAYAVEFYKANSDPRVTRFYSPSISAGGQYFGNYFGDQGTKNAANIGPGVLKAFGQPSIVMLSAESYFLQAEAVLRGWITSAETAQTLYEKGVAASFTYLGLTQAQAQTYYNQAGNKLTTWAVTTTFQERLTLIITQKWASEAWINELESYNDYRRLRIPNVPLSTSNLSTGILPNRLIYPSREYDVNGPNVLAQGTITPGTKVWWQP